MSDNIGKYKIVLARCSECGREIKLGFERNANRRWTYCMGCGEAVWWEEVRRHDFWDQICHIVRPKVGTVNNWTSNRKKATRRCIHCGHSEVYVKAFNIQCQMEKVK